MKKTFIVLMILAFILMFLGWNSCTITGEDGKDGKNGKMGHIGLTGTNGEDGTDGESIKPIVTTLYDGEILNRNFNTLPLVLDGAVFGGIRFTNTSECGIVIYFSFDDCPNIFNSQVVELSPHESYGWYEVIDYDNLYWKSCSIGKTVKIELLKF
jgi:hypothetical protein